MKFKKQHTKNFKSFACKGVQWSSEGKKVYLNVIHGPSHVDFSLFSQEIESLVLESEISEADVIYLGDFNIWVDNIENNVAQNFLSFLNNFSLVNLVIKLTYDSGHTLHFVITKNYHSL